MTDLILTALISFLIGKSFGWRIAHLTVAEECKKLGRFYVRGKVYECQNIIAVTKTPEHNE